MLTGGGVGTYQRETVCRGGVVLGSRCPPAPPPRWQSVGQFISRPRGAAPPANPALPSSLTSRCHPTPPPPTLHARSLPPRPLFIVRSAPINVTTSGASPSTSRGTPPLLCATPLRRHRPPPARARPDGGPAVDTLLPRRTADHPELASTPPHAAGHCQPPLPAPACTTAWRYLPLPPARPRCALAWRGRCSWKRRRAAREGRPGGCVWGVGAASGGRAVGETASPFYCSGRQQLRHAPVLTPARRPGSSRQGRPRRRAGSPGGKRPAGAGGWDGEGGYVGAGAPAAVAFQTARGWPWEPHRGGACSACRRRGRLAAFGRQSPLRGGAREPLSPPPPPPPRGQRGG